LVREIDGSTHDQMQIMAVSSHQTRDAVITTAKEIGMRTRTQATPGGRKDRVRLWP